MSASATHPSRAALPEELQHLRDELRRRGIVDAVKQVAGAFSANSLLVFASAISFRIVFALVPFALFAIALLGFLDAEEVWRDSVAPEIQDRTSEAAFTVVAGTVERVLNAKEGFWLTAGAALALWEVSGGVRVIMRALDRIYGADRPRPGLKRLAISIGLSFPLAGFLLGALASAQLLPPALDRRLDWDVVGALGGRLVGWGIAVLLLAGAVGLLVRFAPSSRQPFQLVGAASLLVVLAWAAVSAAFGFYATHIASYGSIFGGLTFVIVLLTYVYLSSVTFLAGVQIDSYLRGLADHGRGAPDVSAGRSDG